MQRHDEKIWTYAAVTVFSVIGASCALTVVSQLPGWGEKRPEWIGAIGTVAAFGGALWVATSEWRQRHAEKRDLATVAAAQLYDRVEEALEVMAWMQEQFGDSGRIDLPTLSKARHYLETLETWTADEVLPLVFLQRHVAPRLQRVLVRRGRMLRRIKRLQDHGNAGANSGYEQDLRSDVRKNVLDLTTGCDQLYKLLEQIFNSDEELTPQVQQS